MIGGKNKIIIELATINYCDLISIPLYICVVVAFAEVNNIPSSFTGSVKLKGVVLIGGEDEYHPKELRLFKNRPPLGFDDLRGEPDQSIQLSRDTAGTLEYPVK